MTPIKQTPSECRHYFGCALCNLDVKKSNMLGGGYWIKCCDVADDPDYPDYHCPDYEPKENKDEENQ